MKPTVEQWLADGRRKEPSIDASLKAWELRHYPLRKRDPKETKKAHRAAVYVPEEMLVEALHEASRRRQTLSQVLARAWLIARGEIKKYPTHTEP